MIWVEGYGFPDFVGGPMWLADSLDLRRIAERAQHHASSRGNAAGHWTLAVLLTERAASGTPLASWRR